MTDDESQIALGLIELAMMQEQANVTSMKKHLQTMAADGRELTHDQLADQQSSRRISIVEIKQAI